MIADEKEEPLAIQIVAGRAMMHVIIYILPLLQILLVAAVLAAPASVLTRTLAILLGVGILLVIGWQRHAAWRSRR